MYVVGHKNPDTDSVCASIALAELKTKSGETATPIIQGVIGAETKYVLDKFGVDAPKIISDCNDDYVKDKGIFLVDHCELSQTIDNLDTAKLKGIVDHHKLGDITSQNPIEIWMWPVGCTCTIIKRMFDFYELKPEIKTAKIMLSAILSDTVIFKSATCTNTDKIVAKELAQYCGIEDINKLGMDMFKAKSEIKDATAKELVMRDYKDFEMNGKKIGIGQLEMIDISMIENKKNELREELQKLKNEGRHSVLLLLTDIMKEGSEMLIESDDIELIAKAFEIDPKEDNWLEGVMSRKKQVVPKLEKAFEKP